jgi:phosphotransferase system HPr (HPr) family protein
VTATRTVTIADPQGLHARPAAEFVTASRDFESDLELQVGDKSANCKSLLSVLKLGIAHGTSVTLRATGADEERAVTELAERLGHQVQGSSSP